MSNRPQPPSSPPPLSPAKRRSSEAAALVRAAKNGDQSAFDTLVRRYRPRIFALALHLTGSRSDADDVTQDAFLRAYNNLHRFEGRSEFFTWLYRIALNRALNMRRNRRKRSTLSLGDPRIAMAIAVDAAGDPRRALELRETYTLLVRAFDHLSPLLKTTVVLTTLQGLSYKEAAVVLETTEGTIAWRVHEARRKMNEAISSLSRDPSPFQRQRSAEEPGSFFAAAGHRSSGVQPVIGRPASDLPAVGRPTKAVPPLPKPPALPGDAAHVAAAHVAEVAQHSGHSSLEVALALVMPQAASVK